MTPNKDFYSAIIIMLSKSTNLEKIKEKLELKKQNLNYYLRKLKDAGYIYSKSRGWYELTEKGKIFTEYGGGREEDTCRGHAYVWRINIPKSIDNWDKRIEILKKKSMNFKLVGVSKNIPRIEILGRKIWLCKEQIRIFDKKGASYFGSDAKEARKLAFYELMNILGRLENKMGMIFRPSNIHLQKEHYALVKNDLARMLNDQGIILRVKDDCGEWLIVDNSLGDGGELEAIGKEAYPLNLSLQDWFNSHKRTGFKVTPEFVLNTMNGIQNNQLMFDKNIESHLRVLGKMEERLDDIGIAIKNLTNSINNKN